MKYSLSLLLLLVSILAIIYSPVANASLGTFQQNSCVDIKTILNATQVNISTLSYPNATLIVSNKVMSKAGYTFNYTTCNTTELGVYIYDYFDNAGNVYVNSFEITPSGTILTTSQAIIYFVFVIIAIGLFIICFYYALKLEWNHPRDEDGFLLAVNDLKYFKVAAIVGCYLLALFITGMMTGITRNFTYVVGISGFFEWAFWILLSLIYPIMVVTLIFILIIFLTNRKLTKTLERGIPTQ